MRFLGIALATIGILGASPLALAARAVVFSTEPGLTITADLALDAVPRVGYLPCRVTIKNGLSRDGVWDLSFSSRNEFSGASSVVEIYRQSLPVRANETGKFDILLPVLPIADAVGGYAAPVLSIDGPGVRQPREFLPSNSGVKRTVYVGMTPALATPSWGALQKAVEDDKSTLLGSAVNPANLGADWRGWLGLDCLWTTVGEYEALTPEVRRAMEEWIFQGGAVMFCLQPGEEIPALFQKFSGSDAHYGLGRIESIAWDPASPPIAEAVRWIAGRPQGTADKLAASYDDATPIIKSVGRPTLNVLLLSLFVVAFAVTVGPLNLLWFARSGRRHRLFWTTPLISLTGSVALALAIVLQDGVGGSGARVVFSSLLPGGNRMLVMQEQASRTGVLAFRSFRVPENAFVTPIFPNGLPRRSGELNVDGDGYSGNWFASRMVQAQFLEAIVPTRQSVELTNPQEHAAGAAPVLLSSIPGTLAHLYWIDREDGVWHAESVASGRRVTMKKVADTTSARMAIEKQVRPGPMILNALECSADVPGNFYAVAESGPFLATLSSIRWWKDLAIYTGPIAVRPTP